DQLWETLSGVMRYWRRRLPNTPIWLLSPLAEGADQLAAEVLLTFRKADPDGFRLIAPLPMARAEYEADFSAEGLARFRELAAEA
ncbi:MAG: hypothetical protein ABEJ96_02700, partial [Thiohalorhabdaceae bacterium]